MGLFNFFKKQHQQPKTVPPASAPMVQPANPGTTRIEREHFLLHAPFEWKAVPPSKELEYEFRNQALPEQLIVTVLLTRDPLDEARRRSVVQDLSNIRLGVIAKLCGGHSQHTAPQQNEGDGQYEMRYSGMDKSNGIKFAFVVRAASDRVVTVALTRYLLDDVGIPFDAYYGLIFDLLQLKGLGKPAAS